MECWFIVLAHNNLQRVSRHIPTPLERFRESVRDSLKGVDDFNGQSKEMFDALSKEEKEVFQKAYDEERKTPKKMVVQPPLYFYALKHPDKDKNDAKADFDFTGYLKAIRAAVATIAV